ncbi:MAG TPA: hypothetical protein VHT05_09250 [Candidatus Elarobacter sp.]|nr:hypothetical protein [Candidatus Elarobacter sp.]
MNRWENLVALAAIVLAACALLPLPAYPRIACAVLAVATLLIVCSLRLRTFLARREAPKISDTYAKIERIRSARGPRRR